MVCKTNCKKQLHHRMLFENHPKCLVTVFDPQVSGYQKLAKSTIFVIEWDIFYEFQTSYISPDISTEIAIQTQTVNLMVGIKMIDFDQMILQNFDNTKNWSKKVEVFIVLEMIHQFRSCCFTASTNCRYSFQSRFMFVDKSYI